MKKKIKRETKHFSVKVDEKTNDKWHQMFSSPERRKTCSYDTVFPFHGGESRAKVGHVSVSQA